MSTAAQQRAKAATEEAEAEDAADAQSSEAKTAPPEKQFTLRPAQWDVDAVEFAYDGDTLHVAKSGYVVAGEAEADKIVEAAGQAGFPLTKEG